MDKKTYVKIKLLAREFDDFYCGESKISIGIDVPSMNGLLKAVNDNDPIIMYMTKKDRNKLYIRSINDNDEGYEMTDVEIFLVDIDNEELKISRTKFHNNISMTSDNFQNM